MRDDDEGPLVYSASKVSWTTAAFVERTPSWLLGFSLKAVSGILLVSVLASLVLKKTVSIRAQGVLLSPHSVELHLPKKDLRLVLPGMRVTFPFESRVGEIDTVSTQEGNFFKAHVLLEANNNESGSEVSLKSGTPVFAVVILGEKTFFNAMLLGLRRGGRE